MAQLIYPPSARIQEIEEDLLPEMMADDPFFDFFPQEKVDEYDVVWEQFDNVAGLMQVRGLNNAPQPVRPRAINQFSQIPGAYGEYIAIDERKLTMRRKIGTFGDPVDVTDLVMEAEVQLLDRDIKRQKYMGWTLLQTGSYAAVDRQNVIAHTMQFTPRTFTAANPWSNFAASTPLQDMRTIALGHRGTSAVFDRGAVAFMNQTTANNLLQNANALDLYGRRTQGLGTLNTLQLINDLFMGENLPQVRIYEEGYYDDIIPNLFNLFIQTGKVVVIGRRPRGTPIGSVMMVRNANNANMAPGPYVHTVEKEIDSRGPRGLELHRGWSGGIILRYPKAIYVMNV